MKIYRTFQTTELIFFHLTITVELAVVCCGKPWNLRKCRVEYTEFFRGKLWSLVISEVKRLFLIRFNHDASDNSTLPNFTL